MARASTKVDLIESANSKFEKLWDIINKMSESEENGTLVYGDFIGKERHWGRDKNLRDILIHLYEWHMLLLNWVDSNISGNEKSFLKEGYNWKTYGDMNVEFWENHQDTSLEKAKDMILESHKKVVCLAEKFSNDELFSKNVFLWVGGSTLGSYFVSTTSSHYDWAMKKLRKYLKVVRNK
ncbi:ClbS/DfsB family four-helix bundle protein [Miniphocaeibacter massiliensis]|uniref:ClbS/DfsB family four-helix bundle protein n=1 Tax=Miniphocaeibacter massiliensis TaxID=2041841 RepID=UPI000C08CC97|nr:ClbS/DfsB family four-helix bundle protein [Miniphocaeibacter massiliensis]